MNIGITVSLKKNENLFVNGVKLNAMYLCNLLRRGLNHNAYLLDLGHDIEEGIGNYEENVKFNTSEIPIFKYDSMLEKTDLMIYLGVTVRPERIQQFKSISKNKKTIQYKCGNDYVIDMERCIHPKKELGEILPSWYGGTDQVWYVPQQEYQNQEYFETIYSKESKDVFPVPFIWDPMFLKDSYEKAKYVPSSKNKKICTFEPNMNVVKYCMVPMLITENAYREGVKYDVHNIYSGDRLMKNTYFKSDSGILTFLKSIMEPLGKGESPKMYFHNKYMVMDILQRNDVVLSHQWENPLNYAYLDSLYYGYPLVHNANLIQDAGYYYNDFKIKEGARRLKEAIEEHDIPENLESYNLNSNKVLSRYTIENEKMLLSYNQLIEDLFRGISKERNYNWKENITL